MLKQFIKEQLAGHRLRLYEKKLEAQRIGYDAWERERESAGKASGKAGAPIQTVSYGSIGKFLAGGISKQGDPEELILFCAEEGALSGNAYMLCREYAAAHPELSLFYGDEDELGEQGAYENPYLKPDWSPDTFESAFYIGSVFLARYSLLQKLPREFLETGMDHGDPDLLFRQLARLAGGFEKRQGKAFVIGHIREILFHRVKGTDLFRGRSHRRSGPVEAGEKAPLVSVIIPSKDHPELLEKCVSSIVKYASVKQPYELIVVDNGSAAENRSRYEAVLDGLPLENGLTRRSYLYKPMDFNFSGMCDLGAECAKGELFLFLNDDIEAIEAGWMESLAALAGDPRIGAVGAKLLYPGGELIQHAGITNVRLGPVHKLSHLPDGEDWYFGRNLGIHDVIGVTGACLMLAREKFAEAGGFPRQLPVAFNDVDLCYTLFELGYYNVQDNLVRALHHESASRGLDTEDPAKIRRMAAEYDILMDRHPGMYHYDPFYHPQLIEDEHTSVFVFYEDGLKTEALPLARGRVHGNGIPGAREDACLRLGLEYAGPLEKWERGLRNGAAEDGYYAKGYSFVIGSDNACYERRLLLQKLSHEGNVLPEIYEFPAEDWYRPDIAEQTRDQLHTELSGFKARIPAGILAPGEYRIGMLAIDKTSRLRLMSWVPNMLVVK